MLAALPNKPAGACTRPRHAHAALQPYLKRLCRGRRTARDTAPCAFRPGRTRVTRTIASIPLRVDRYFAESVLRRVLWCCTSLFVGYYAGNMVSLAFGTLAINDVVAAIMTVAVAEVISRAFYSQWPRPALWVMFANFFKMGVTMAYMADAYKLAG